MAGGDDKIPPGLRQFGTLTGEYTEPYKADPEEKLQDPCLQGFSGTRNYHPLKEKYTFAWLVYRRKKVIIR